MKRILIPTLLFLPFLIVVLTFTANAMNLFSHYRIAYHPAIAEGIVTRKLSAEDHYHVMFSFEANSRKYEAEGAVGDAYESMMIGSKVPVVYDAKKPAVAAIFDPGKPGQWGLANPRDNFLSMLALCSIFSVIGGAMFSGSVIHLLSKR